MTYVKYMSSVFRYLNHLRAKILHFIYYTKGFIAGKGPIHITILVTCALTSNCITIREINYAYLEMFVFQSQTMHYIEYKLCNLK